MSTSTFVSRQMPRALAVALTAVLALGAVAVGASAPASAAVPYTVTGKLTGVPTPGAAAVALANVQVTLIHQLEDSYYTEVDQVKTDSAGNYSLVADAADAAREDWADTDKFSVKFNCS